MGRTAASADNVENKITRWQSYSFTTQVFPTLAALLQHPHGVVYFHRYLSSPRFFEEFPSRRDQELHQSRFHFWLDCKTYASTPALSDKELIGFAERLLRKYEKVPEVSEYAITLTGSGGGMRSLSTVELTIPLAQIFDDVRRTVYDRLAVLVFPSFLLSHTAADLMGDLLAPVDDEVVVKKKKRFFHWRKSSALSKNSKLSAPESGGGRSRGSTRAARSRSPSPLPHADRGPGPELIETSHVYANPDLTANNLKSQLVSVILDKDKGKMTPEKSSAPPPMASPVLPELAPGTSVSAPQRLFPSLQSILACPTATRYFRSFLLKSSATKAVKLVFLQCVQDFRSDESQIGQLQPTPNPQEIVESARVISDARSDNVLKETARTLYDRFFGSDAPKDNQIPLTWNVLSEIMEAVEKDGQVTPTLFDKAYDEVYNSLSNVEYKEFIASPSSSDLFGELTDTLDESKIAVSTLARTFPSFDDILKSPLAVRYFREFLEKEEAKESEWDIYSQPLLDSQPKPKLKAPALNNLDFVLKVQSFASTWQTGDAQKRHDAAQAIYDLFVSRKAPSPIGLSLFRRSKLERQLHSNCDAQLYNNAAAEVAQVLAHCDYPRFVVSDQAKLLVDRLKSQERVARLKMMFPTPGHILKERSLQAQYFERYLTREYCQENFEFYMAVEEFKRTPRSKTLQVKSLYDKAVDIRNKFLLPGSDQEINIAASVINATLKDLDTLDEVTPELFDKCQQAVYELVAPNVDRFLRSDLGEQLLRQLDRFSVSSNFRVAEINGPQLAQSVPMVRNLMGTLRRPPSQANVLTPSSAGGRAGAGLVARAGSPQVNVLPPPPAPTSPTPTSGVGVGVGVVEGEDPPPTDVPKDINEVRNAIEDFFSQGAGAGGDVDVDIDSDHPGTMSATGAGAPGTSGHGGGEGTCSTFQDDPSIPMFSDSIAGRSPVVQQQQREQEEAERTRQQQGGPSNTGTAGTTATSDPLDGAPASAPTSTSSVANMHRSTIGSTEPVCPGCGDFVIEGGPKKTVTALDCLWHADHFKCAHCEVVLTGDSYLVRDGVPYCFDDFHALFTASCYGCGTEINGMHITALYNRWHSDCFVCHECKQPFNDLAFYAYEGRPYCENHCPTSNVCAECDKPIESTSVSALGKTYHEDCFVCFTCKNPLSQSGFFDFDDLPYCDDHYPKHGEFCAKCEERITGIKTTALNTTWHQECFVCTKCDATFTDGIFVAVEGKPYCPNHSPDATTCMGCDQAIGGSYLNALDGAWHDTCFVCTTCRQPFTEGFFTENNKPYCPQHNPQIASCNGCGKAITSTFYPVEGHKYHGECLKCKECGVDLMSQAYRFIQDALWCKDHLPS